MAAPTIALASTGPSPIVGHVYVNDNTAGTNTIGAFDRHADGTLTPEARIPVRRRRGRDRSGAGVAGRAADLARRQVPDRHRRGQQPDLGAADRVDGSLRLVPGGVVPSGGVLPVSIAVHGDLVYVANSGDGGSNYTGFRLNGRRQPGAGPRLDGRPARWLCPGDVLFSGDGTKLAGTRVGTSLIDSFTVGDDGRLNAAPGSPFAAQGLGPFGSEFRPTNPDQLFVSNAHNVGAGTGTVSAFRDSANGTLTPIGSSPFADAADGSVLGGDQP